MNYDNRERLIAEASKIRDITKLDIDEGLKLGLDKLDIIFFDPSRNGEVNPLRQRSTSPRYRS